jgi:hypothetical protein
LQIPDGGTTYPTSVGTPTPCIAKRSKPWVRPCRRADESTRSARAYANLVLEGLHTVQEILGAEKAATQYCNLIGPHLRRRTFTTSLRAVPPASAVQPP